MIAPEKPAPEPTEDDDFELDLAETETALEEDESVGPEEDADLGVEEDEREVGLDAETGLEDALDDAEELAVEDDSGSWLDDDLGTGADDDDGEDEEEDSALGEDGEPPGEQGTDFDDDLSFEEGEPIAEDSGDEGFSDDSILAGLELENLPRLDAPAEGEEGLELEGELLPEAEPSQGTQPAAPPAEPGPRVVVELLQRSGRPLSALIAAGETGLAWDGSLLVTEPDAARAERRFAGVDTVYALAAASGKAPLIALATPAGLMCSHDGGRSFEPVTALGSGAFAPSTLALTDVGSGPVLWAAPPGGALHRSADRGRSFEAVGVLPRVLRLASDGRSQLVVLGRDAQGSACAARSDDGGESFAALRLPFSEVERTQDLQVCGAAVVCSRRGLSPQLLWCGEDGEFGALFRDAAPPVALIDDGGTTWAYCCRATRGGHALVRIELSAAPRAPELLLELPPDAGAPLQLSGAQRDSAITLQLGCERAWYRIRVWAEGLLL